MSTKAKLFENSESEDENVTLKTNTSYAKHYDEFRKKEVLSHRELSKKFNFSFVFGYSSI